MPMQLRKCANVSTQFQLHKRKNVQLIIAYVLGNEGISSCSTNIILIVRENLTLPLYNFSGLVVFLIDNRAEAYLFPNKFSP